MSCLELNGWAVDVGLTVEADIAMLAMPGVYEPALAPAKVARPVRFEPVPEG
jgi:hypothetical protein